MNIREVVVSFCGCKESEEDVLPHNKSGFQFDYIMLASKYSTILSVRGYVR